MNFLERNLIRIPIAALLCVLVWQAAILPNELARQLRPVGADLQAASGNLKDASYHLAVIAQDLHVVSGALADPRSGIARTLRNVNTVTAQIGRTSNVARLASSEQRQYLQQLSAESIATLKAANALIERANQNLNDGALPAFTADLVQIRASLLSLTQDGHEAIGAATASMNAAGKLLADPSIPAATKSLAGAGAHLDGTSANIEQATGYLRDMFKPTKQSFWKTLVLGNLPAAILHFLPQRVSVVNEPTVKTEPKE